MKKNNRRKTSFKKIPLEFFYGLKGREKRHRVWTFAVLLIVVLMKVQLICLKSPKSSRKKNIYWWNYIVAYLNLWLIVFLLQKFGLIIITKFLFLSITQKQVLTSSKKENLSWVWAYADEIPANAIPCTDKGNLISQNCSLQCNI